MIKQESSFIVSSDPLDGAINKSVIGSSFDVALTGRPLAIPEEAIDVTLEVTTATIWWTIPNIETGINDLFFLDDNATPRNITVPQGLYDVPGLAAAIERELVNAGAAANIITISADTATQKIVITHNITGITIDFTPAQTFRDILGFNSQVLGPNITAPLAFLAPNVANFNIVEYFLLTGNIVDLGLRINNTYNNNLARVYIDVRPGSQILYTPQNPTKQTASKLRGRKITSMSFTLTDQNGRLVNTAGEDFSIEITIRYLIPLKSLQTTL